MENELVGDDLKNHKDVFREIYEKNSWGDKESVSGSGSTIRQTQKLIPQLEDLFDYLKIRTILDIPCGDFNWFSKVKHSAQYIGADIVHKLIHNNQDKHPNIDFRILDLTEDQLPTSDLILCRDCLVHFPISSIQQSLKNIKKSGSKWLLMTNFTKERTNIDIKFGEWRPLNFLNDPFNLIPMIQLKEDCIEYEDKTKTLCLYEISKI